MDSVESILDKANKAKFEKLKNSITELIKDVENDNMPVAYDRTEKASIVGRLSAVVNLINDQISELSEIGRKQFDHNAKA